VSSHQPQAPISPHGSINDSQAGDRDVTPSAGARQTTFSVAPKFAGPRKQHESPSPLDLPHFVISTYACLPCHRTSTRFLNPLAPCLSTKAQILHRAQDNHPRRSYLTARPRHRILLWPPPLSTRASTTNKLRVGRPTAPVCCVPA